MSSSDTTSNVGMGSSPEFRLGMQNGRPDTLRGPGSVPEWTKGAGCKPAAKATLVRIQPGPLERSPAVAAGVLASEHLLHLDHVEPLAELPADLPLGADGLEAAGRVQRDGGVVLPGDAGDHGVEAVGGREPQQLVQEPPADAPALVAVEQVDRVLDRGAVGGAGPEARER